MENLSKEQKNKLEKMAQNMDKMAIHANLPIVDELSEVNEHLEGIHENLKMMAEKPMPKMEMPEKHKVEIMGAELVTIKGEQGIQGEKGEQGIQGNDGKNGEKGDKGERGDRKSVV